MNRSFSITAAAAGVAVAALMIAAPVSAADIPVKGPLYREAAPFNWNGCYAGLQGGTAWASANQTPTGRNLNPTGYFAGGQLGCNWHFSPTLVLGVEIDAAGANLTELRAFTANLTIEERIKSIVTARARLGHTMGNSLLYLTAGAAWANAERFTRLFGNSGTASATHTGWVVGFGIEHAFSSRWSGKIEYLYHDLGSQTYVYNFGLNPTVALTLSTLKFGVNYRF